MAETPRLEAASDGVLRVTGALEFETVTALAAGADALPWGAGRVVIDLGGVAGADSAGLALLVHWMRLARRRDQALEFRNVPSQLMDMARLSGLDGILPLQSD